jgi:hypothetical protein
VEGILGVASIKSMLNKNTLEDVLAGLAAIPPSASLEGRVTFGLFVKNYDDWPYKIIYASAGISGQSLMSSLLDFYAHNRAIPLGRRPNIIHVAGQYIIIRATKGLSIWEVTTQQEETPPAGTFCLFTHNPDIQGLVWVVDGLQHRAMASTHIHYSYIEIANQVLSLPA